MVRSARQFQNAILIAESEPELAWPTLILAIETAANEWVSSWPMGASREEIFRELKLEFSHRILERGGREVDQIVVAQVAHELARNLQATKKFLTFSIELLPLPHQERPPEHAQIDWEKKITKKILNKIHDYRASALHAGIPFPAPLGTTPWIVERDKP
ncbi:MAG: hypothetical protein WAM11_01405 [Cyanobium sp.]